MKQQTEIIMGQLPDSWKEGKAKSITLCVTEDCNLACKYCYMTGKNKKNKMSFETARKVIDYILTNREIFNEEAVVWDFIGGEPFLEIELIDKICDYIRQRMFLLKHPWFDAYRFSFSTNGVLYSTPQVQAYIKKNIGHLSIGMSVDGNKLKHDLQRVKPDGSGSYDDVVKNVPLWQKQFPGASTKATFAHDDLPYLKDSIISLWELGIKMVLANVVFEDVWHEGDDIIFENQLKALGDYVLENELWKEYSVRFFAPSTGTPLSEESLDVNFCGSGKMLAIDCKGDFYPCVRFYDMSLGNRKGICIGNVHDGINNDRLRAFETLTLRNQSPEECIRCEVGTGCAWCTGSNYDMADSDTIFQRMTFICKMHKANVWANEYFWDRFSRVTGLISPREELLKGMGHRLRQKYLHIIPSNDIIPHCMYRNKFTEANPMNPDTFVRGLRFAEENGFVPILLSNGDKAFTEYDKKKVRIVSSQMATGQEDEIVIYDNGLDDATDEAVNTILLINKTNIGKLGAFIRGLCGLGKRVNLVLEDIWDWKEEEINQYTVQLESLIPFILESYTQGEPVEINVLTDLLDETAMCNCEAGSTSFALAPNGRIYICPAFYFDDPESYVGTLDDGIHVKNQYLMELSHSPICSVCDAYHCKRCKFLNKKMTGEFNTPPKVQCVISHIERSKTMELQKILLQNGISVGMRMIEELDYLDPYEKLKNKGGFCHV